MLHMPISFTPTPKTALGGGGQNNNNNDNSYIMTCQTVVKLNDAIKAGAATHTHLKVGFVSGFLYAGVYLGGGDWGEKGERILSTVIKLRGCSL